MEKFMGYLVAIAFFCSGLLYTNTFFDVENDRAKYFIDDQNRKSAVELNISAAAGNRYLSRAEVVTTILADTSNIAVAIDGIIIPQEKIILAKRNLYDISGYMQNNTYEASNVFDASGRVIGIQYLTVQ